MIKTLIADDGPIARKMLRDELKTSGEIEVIGEAEDGENALK